MMRIMWEKDTHLFVWGMVLFLFAIVDIVAFCGREFLLKIGNSGCDENVVPLEQLFDVAVVDTLTVPFGQHFGEIVVQFVGRSLLVVEAGYLSAF